MATTHGNNAEGLFTELPVKTVRSGNYTVAAGEVANGFTSPINVAFPSQFKDTNYTVSINVEVLKSKGPTAIYNVRSFTKQLSSVAVELTATNAQAGDILVI